MAFVSDDPLRLNVLWAIFIVVAFNSISWIILMVFPVLNGIIGLLNLQTIIRIKLRLRHRKSKVIPYFNIYFGIGGIGIKSK